jgi:hypothetical protein
MNDIIEVKVEKLTLHRIHEYSGIVLKLTLCKALARAFPMLSSKKATEPTFAAFAAFPQGVQDLIWDYSLPGSRLVQVRLDTKV